MSQNPSMCSPRRWSAAGAATASRPGSALPVPNAHWPPATTAAASRAERQADHRQRRERTPADAGRAPDRQHRAEQRTPRRVRTFRRMGHHVSSEIPASSKVAIEARVAMAARTIGNATAAPVPSPSRMPRSTIGSSLQMRQRQAVGRLGRPVPGLPPRPRARRQLLGHQGRGRHHQAVQENRGAPHGGLGEESRHGSQVGTAAHAQQPQRIACHLAGPVQRVADRGRPCASSRGRRCRCRGPPPRPARRPSGRPPKSLPPWYFRFPCRRR